MGGAGKGSSKRSLDDRRRRRRPVAAQSSIASRYLAAIAASPCSPILPTSNSVQASKRHRRRREAQSPLSWTSQSGSFSSSNGSDDEEEADAPPRQRASTPYARKPPTPTTATASVFPRTSPARKAPLPATVEPQQQQPQPQQQKSTPMTPQAQHSPPKAPASVAPPSSQAPTELMANVSTLLTRHYSNGIAKPKPQVAVFQSLLDDEEDQMDVYQEGPSLLDQVLSSSTASHPPSPTTAPQHQSIPKSPTPPPLLWSQQQQKKSRDTPEPLPAAPRKFGGRQMGGVGGGDQPRLPGYQPPPGHPPPPQQQHQQQQHMGYPVLSPTPLYNNNDNTDNTLLQPVFSKDRLDLSVVTPSPERSYSSHHNKKTQTIHRLHSQQSASWSTSCSTQDAEVVEILQATNRNRREDANVAEGRRPPNPGRLSVQERIRAWNSGQQQQQNSVGSKGGISGEEPTHPEEEDDNASVQSLKEFFEQKGKPSNAVPDKEEEQPQEEEIASVQSLRERFEHSFQRGPLHIYVDDEEDEDDNSVQSLRQKFEGLKSNSYLRASSPKPITVVGQIKAQFEQPQTVRKKRQQQQPTYPSQTHSLPTSQHEEEKKEAVPDPPSLVHDTPPMPVSPIPSMDLPPAHQEGAPMEMLPSPLPISISPIPHMDEEEEKEDGSMPYTFRESPSTPPRHHVSPKVATVLQEVKSDPPSSAEMPTFSTPDRVSQKTNSQQPNDKETMQKGRDPSPMKQSKPPSSTGGSVVATTPVLLSSIMSRNSLLSKSTKLTHRERRSLLFRSAAARRNKWNESKMQQDENENDRQALLAPESSNDVLIARTPSYDMTNLQQENETEEKETIVSSQPQSASEFRAIQQETGDSGDSSSDSPQPQPPGAHWKTTSSTPNHHHIKENKAIQQGPSTDSTDHTDGVTLDVSIAEVSLLTNPTALHSSPDSSKRIPRSEASSSDALGSSKPSSSEASSSQMTEAAAPLLDDTVRLRPMSDEFSRASGFGDPYEEDGEDFGVMFLPSSLPNDHPDTTWDVGQIDTSFPESTKTESPSGLGDQDSDDPFSLLEWQPFDASDDPWRSDPGSDMIGTVSDNVDEGDGNEHFRVIRPQNSSASSAAPRPTTPTRERRLQRYREKNSIFYPADQEPAVSEASVRSPPSQAEKRPVEQPFAMDHPSAHQSDANDQFEKESDTTARGNRAIALAHQATARALRNVELNRSYSSSESRKSNPSSNGMDSRSVSLMNRQRQLRQRRASRSPPRSHVRSNPGTSIFGRTHPNRSSPTTRSSPRFTTPRYQSPAEDTSVFHPSQTKVSMPSTGLYSDDIFPPSAIRSEPVVRPKQAEATSGPWNLYNRIANTFFSSTSTNKNAALMARLQAVKESRKKRARQKSQSPRRRGWSTASHRQSPRSVVPEQEAASRRNPSFATPDTSMSTPTSTMRTMNDSYQESHSWWHDSAEDATSLGGPRAPLKLRHTVLALD